MTLDTHILAGPKDVELKGAKLMEQGAPCFIWTFNMQQVNCLRDRDGEIIEGANKDYWSMRKCNQITAIRNLNWPGSVSLGWAPIAGTPNLWKYANIYVGFGTKFSNKPYTPPAPPMICSEYVPPAGTDDNGALCVEFSDAAILKDPHPLQEEEEDDE